MSLDMLRHLFLFTIVAPVATALALSCSGGDAPSVDVDGGDGGSDSDADGDSDSDGDGDSDSDSDSDGDSDSDSDSDTSAPNMLTGTVRDFLDTHPDFEAELGAEQGIVEEQLGEDGKPVYAGGDGTTTTHGSEAFDQWFRDVPGVNESAPLTIELENLEDDIWTYDNQEFFPIDDQLQGNQGREHNYHFTYEINTSFTYQGGEVFGFTGDDDLFVFVNDLLVIDIGGVHGPLSSEADFDELADELGIEQGVTYDLDFFFAERHTTQSTFRIDTTIAEFNIE